MAHFIGQEKEIGLIDSMHNKGILPHALLFYGAGGLGKYTLAHSIARWLSCEESHELNRFLKTECSCPSCSRSVQPDVYDEASPLPIKEARELKDKLSRSPYEGKYKVVIFNKAETMHKDAANSLLKTLEEPHEDTYFILTSEYPEMVLDTIRSRCMNIPFSFVSNEDISNTLNTSSISDLISHWSGRPGIANRLINDEEYESQIRSWRGDCETFLKEGLSKRFQIADKYAKIKDDRGTLTAILRVWMERAREIDSDIVRNDILSRLNYMYRDIYTTNANFSYLSHNFAVTAPNI